LDSIKLKRYTVHENGATPVSFTYADYKAREVAPYLASKGLFVWDGDFYATTVVERLGLADRGGLIRIGIAPYNTKEELERLIAALKDEGSLQAFIANLTSGTLEE
jgi:selenocysteine lyase/cysteine desulfurase